MESIIESLPYDLLNCIFKFVDNKMPLSRTCILLNQQLRKLFNDGQLVNYNDPYFLSKCYNEDNILEIIKYVDQIHDSKNLNYVCVMFDKDYTLTCDSHCLLAEKLLKQYCIILDPMRDGLHILMNHFKNWSSIDEHYLTVIFIITFAFKSAIKHKSYMVAFTLMEYFDFLSNNWLDSASKRMNDKDEWDNILNEIKHVPNECVPFENILSVLTGGKELKLDCELARYLNKYLYCYGFRLGRF